MTFNNVVTGTMLDAIDRVEKEKGKISFITDRHYEWVESMGWHNKSTLESLALIASEVGEAVNECRGDKPTTEFGEELADIALRLFDLAKTEGVDLTDEIWKKVEKNLKNGNIKNRSV